MGEQNTIQDTIQDYIKSFEKVSADLFETATEAFVGKADSLRDGTEYDPVELPRDLYAHRNAQTEWWYYTGILKLLRERVSGLNSFSLSAGRIWINFP